MRRVDLGAAAAAGLAVVLPLYQILTLPEMCESPRLTHGESAALLAAFASYLCVPLLPGRRPARLVWLWTPVLGSLLCASALHGLLVSQDWGPGLWAAAWLALCAWTLPFAAAVHYSVALCKRLGGDAFDSPGRRN